MALATLCLRGSPIEMLDLSNNRIGSPGAEAFATSLDRTAALRYLDLRCNSIGDTGLVALAGAFRRNKTLKRLCLWGNQFETAALNAFARHFESTYVLLPTPTAPSTTHPHSYSHPCFSRHSPRLPPTPPPSYSATIMVQPRLDSRSTVAMIHLPHIQVIAAVMSNGAFGGQVVGVYTMQADWCATTSLFPQISCDWIRNRFQTVPRGRCRPNWQSGN